MLSPQPCSCAYSPERPRECSANPRGSAVLSRRGNWSAIVTSCWLRRWTRYRRLPLFFLRGVRWKRRLIDGNRYIFMLDIEAQPVEETHVDVGDPNERQPCNQVAAPAFKQHLEVKDPERQRCDVVRETILAREQVK